MSEPDVTQLVSGSGKLYVAPLGTALPTVDASGEFPVVWPMGWVAVGYTEAGIDAAYAPSMKELTVDEEAAVVGDILQTEKFTVSAQLAEATLANLNRAISASSLVDHSASLGDVHLSAGSLPLTYTMVGIEAPAPGTDKVRLIIVQKAIAKANVSMKIQRKDKVIFPCEFDARKLSGIALFDIYDLTSTAS